MKIADLYKSVTNRIVKDLEAGTAPWTKPWKNARPTGILPHNGATGRAYNGINVLLLWAEREEKGYSTSNWMTFRQAMALGASVRAGEKGTAVVFTKKLNVKDEETQQETVVGLMRVYHVFNEDQIDGLEKEPEPEPALDYFLRIPRAEAFVQATRADVRLGGNKACYVPSLDFIALPMQKQFKSVEHFYAVNLHELVHWSGHEKRLNRELSTRFGTKAYAAEELVAELGAAFLCAHLEIPGELRHAEYLASWVSLLREDERAIFTAASKASIAADYLRSFSQPQEAEQAA